jgi:hypothetical protein
VWRMDAGERLQAVVIGSTLRPLRREGGSAHLVWSKNSIWLNLMMVAG